MLQELEADERASKGDKRQMNVSVALIANGEPAIARQPRERALDHPAVSAQTLSRIDELVPQKWTPRSLLF